MERRADTSGPVDQHSAGALDHLFDHLAVSVYGVPCGSIYLPESANRHSTAVNEALLFRHAPHLLAYYPHASLLGTLWLPCAGNASLGETSGTIAGTRPPLPPDLSHQRRVDDHVPKRLDRGHVGGAEQPVRLEQDRHLPPVAAPSGTQPRCMTAWTVRL